ncbi:MAG: tripartite tricarboxylate transporter substrate binding protein [Rhizobiales bacterium]|nr:tripartite tricarboxylate transporter substrate binding protein [Hyphomicrobiales bacterium]
MNLPRRQFLQLAAAAAAIPVVSYGALAQNYPNRPVKWIVPFPAGGTTDLVARLLGQWLSERLSQPVVIENKPGGGTNIAVQAVVSAPPDGYTLLFILSTNAINVSLYKSLPFDFQSDIVPVAALAELPLVLIANNDLPAKNVPEFVAYAKAHPGKLNVGSFGARTVAHLAIELLKSSTGIDVVHVPYRGSALLVSDLLSGRIQAGIDALPNVLPHSRSGAMRALAVLAPQRTPALPDMPTMGETIKGYEVSTWSGVGIPKGTPDAIVERLNREINAGLQDPGITARLAQVGAVPIIVTPAELRARIAADTDKWAKVVKAAGIKPD